VSATLAMLGCCLEVGGCADVATLNELSADGPTISAVEFAPGRTVAGCRAVLRFHFDGDAEHAVGVTHWMLLHRLRGLPAADASLAPAGSGPLDGAVTGDGDIPLTFPQAGTYHYYLQVEDAAGRWSNALAADIAVDRRARDMTGPCP
jgi:hypothetical protein